MKWKIYFDTKFQVDRAFPAQSSFSKEELNEASAIRDCVHEYNVSNFLFMHRNHNKKSDFMLLFHSVVLTKTQLELETILKSASTNWIVDGLFQRFYVDALEEVPPKILEGFIACYRNGTYNSYVSSIHLGALLVGNGHISWDEFQHKAVFRSAKFIKVKSYLRKKGVKIYG